MAARFARAARKYRPCGRSARVGAQHVCERAGEDGIVAAQRVDEQRGCRRIQIERGLEQTAQALPLRRGQSRAHSARRLQRGQCGQKRQNANVGRFNKRSAIVHSIGKRIATNRCRTASSPSHWHSSRVVTSLVVEPMLTVDRVPAERRASVSPRLASDKPRYRSRAAMRTPGRLRNASERDRRGRLAGSSNSRCRIVRAMQARFRARRIELDGDAGHDESPRGRRRARASIDDFGKAVCGTTAARDSS